MNKQTTMRPILFGLSMLTILLGRWTATESVPLSMLDPQSEVLSREYVTSARVDSALERCLRKTGVESSREIAGASGQLDRIRECMLKEFAGKLSPQHWNIL
ncbi:hypothetical protein FGIG_02936 [Fasciola gigantica]|uniref:Uncharacterized protein n=1 Tax=Fasciola gigantica TaxID=46835 RepID=A0A504YH65_FASGI|nr:hypothetical protein FGIG_02936 [Fasciola gigantica]